MTGWSAARIRLPNGIVIENPTISDASGQTCFSSALAALMSLPPTPALPALPGTALADSVLLPLGKSAVPLPALAQSAVPDAGSSGPLLAGWFEQYLDERARGELAAKTLAEARWVLCRLLLGVCDNKLLRDFSLADRDAVVDALKRWPANADKNTKYAGLTVAEILAAGERDQAPQLAPRTIEKYLDRLRTCFQWAVERQYRDRNPFAKVHLMDKEKRQRRRKQPFSDDDLKRLFDPALRNTCVTAPHKFWAPLVALYGVMRATEIGQLYVDDIVQIGDTWVFQIADVREDQHLKNPQSARVVPVHQQLLDLRFLDYWADVKRFGFQRLFPGLPYDSKNHYGHALSKWFNSGYLRSAKGNSKAPRAGIDAPAKTFHSLRYVGTNRLYGLTENKILVAEISGHERGQDTLTTVYLTPSGAAERAALLNRMQFGFLSFAPYRQGQFDGYFKRLQRKQAAPRRAVTAFRSKTFPHADVPGDALASLSDHERLRRMLLSQIRCSQLLPARPPCLSTRRLLSHSASLKLTTANIQVVDDAYHRQCGRPCERRLAPP